MKKPRPGQSNLIPMGIYQNINPDINRDFPNSHQDKTAIWKIFNWRFRVIIPALYCYSETDIAEFGMVTTGNKDIDDSVNNAPASAALTINDMIELHCTKGVAITIEKPERSVIIYELIREATQAWVDEMRFAVKPRLPPLEDLKKLDDFAAAIWPIARRYYRIPITGVNDLFGTIRRGGFARTLDQAQQQLKDIDNGVKFIEAPKEHKRLSDIVSNLQNERSGS